MKDYKSPFGNFGIIIPSGKVKNGEEDKNPRKMSYSVMPDLIMRHVWSEGYSATGEHSNAMYHGCCLAESHIEACERLVKNLDRNDDGSLRLSSSGLPSIWACRLFDNEKDARELYG